MIHHSCIYVWRNENDLFFGERNSKLLTLHVSTASQEKSLTVAEKLADVAVDRGDHAFPAVKGKKKTETSTAAQTFFWTKDTSKGWDGSRFGLVVDPI